MRPGDESPPRRGQVTTGDGDNQVTAKDNRVIWVLVSTHLSLIWIRLQLIFFCGLSPCEESSGLLTINLDELGSTPHTLAMSIYR